MKKRRQMVILEIINSEDIETQEELANVLRSKGILAKQSTISRDIKELGLTKVLSKEKKYIYSKVVSKEKFHKNRYEILLQSTIMNVERVDKFVVISTISGSAPGAAEAIENLGFRDIVGTVAGDNTILIISRTEEKAESIVNKIKLYINRDSSIY